MMKVNALIEAPKEELQKSSLGAFVF